METSQSRPFVDVKFSSSTTTTTKSLNFSSAVESPVKPMQRGLFR